MTLSPPTPAATPYEWSRVLARGPEAQSFLQGQLSQDVTNVGTNAVWSLLLSPTSVVVSTVLVARDTEGFTLTVPRELSATVYERLRRFLLRTACELTVEDSLDGPFQTVGEQVTGAYAGAREFEMDLTPQSFGPTFVASMVSFTKGCFTGQELVARLDARASSVPWRLVRCAGPTLDAMERALTLLGPEGPKGVTTSVQTQDGVLGLGFIHRSALVDGALVDFGEVRVTPVA